MKTIYFILLIVLSSFFFTGCNNETASYSIPPHINIYGKKIDTVYLNSFYKDEKAEANGCNEVVVTGSVNTSKLGTYYINYDYTDPDGDPAATVTRTVHVVLTYEDSTQIQNAYCLYKKITFAKKWFSNAKQLQKIDIELSSQLGVCLNYTFGNSTSSYKVIDAKNKTIGLVLTTNSLYGDSSFLWTFKQVSPKKGSWSLTKPQINYPINLGTFELTPD